MNNNTHVWQARDSNPAKRYLMEYRTLVHRRDALLDELDRLNDANQRATSRITAIRLSGTSGHGGFEDGALRVVDGEARLQQLVEHIDECLSARLAMIDLLPDERQKLVLTYRYINGNSWEQIMKIMHYAERQAFRVHGEALAEICRMLKDGSK
jgi:hypothetical protein